MLSPQEVTVGDSIELECHLTGSAPIKVTWSKDHKDIRTGGNYKMSCVDNTPHLTIVKADRADTGKYFCHAANDVGKDSCSSDITVKERKNPPVFTKKPSEHIEDMEGKLVKMEGRVSGSQPMSISWFRDSAEISSSDKYDISFKSNVAVLCIKSSQVSDSGSYTCQASNEAGRASCDITVGISEAKKPPVFDVSLKSVTVDEGEKLSLKCHVCGSPPLKIQWMKDRKDLTSAGSTRISFSDGTACLEISPASRHDAGDYLCKASNDSGSEFCKAKVTVKEKPGAAPPLAEAPAAAPPKKLDNLFFIEQPKTAHVTEKGTATFIAKVGGDPIPSVKWMKGKWRQVTHGGRISIEQKGQEAKLEIREVTKSDSGQYRCVASNNHGEIECNTDMHVDEKKEASLLEGDLRAKLKKTPSKQKSPQEEKDIDIVELLRNVDPKEYEKYARMYGITDYRGLLQAIEQLKKEKAEESGRPELERGDRESDEDMARLVADLQKRMERTEPVTVVKDISDQSVFTNKEAEFECEIKINYPEITLSWYKGTQKLDNGDKYHISISGDRHLLKIKKCQSSDQGNYRVVCGPHISSAKLAVMEVEVEKHLQDTSGKEGQSCSLSCQLSIPNVEAHWYKNGKQLEMKGRFTSEVKHKVQKLLIRDLKHEDQGRYTCRYQHLESSADLWVEAEQIHFTKRIHNVEVNERQSATFECEVSFDNAIVSWYKDTWELKESTKYNFTSEDRRHFMVIRNVSIEDEGVYSVIVRLEPRGEAKSTAELYLSGKEIELAMVPMDVPDTSIQRPDVSSSVAIQESAEFYQYEEEIEHRESAEYSYREVEVERRVEYQSRTEETVSQQVSTTKAARVAVEETVETQRIGVREEIPTKVLKAEEKEPEEKPTAALKVQPEVEAKKPVEKKAAVVSVPEKKQVPALKEPEELQKPVVPSLPTEKPGVPKKDESKPQVLAEPKKVAPAAKPEPEPRPKPKAEPEPKPKSSPAPKAEPKPAKIQPEAEAKPAALKKPTTPPSKVPEEPGKPELAKVKPETKPEPGVQKPKPEPEKPKPGVRKLEPPVTKPQPAAATPEPPAPKPVPVPKPEPSVKKPEAIPEPAKTKAEPTAAPKEPLRKEPEPAAKKEVAPPPAPPATVPLKVQGGEEAPQKKPVAAKEWLFFNNSSSRVHLLMFVMLFKVPVEEKRPEPQTAAKEPEAAVAPPKAQVTRKEKALKPKLVPEKAPHKVDEAVELKMELQSDKKPETAPERPAPQKTEVKERVPERPERKVEETPKMAPEKRPEAKVSEKAPPGRRPVEAPLEVTQDERKPPEREALEGTPVKVQEAKIEKVSKKQTERVSVDKTPEVKPEVEETLRKGTAS
ncbi:unnamed protein product [Pleuronectes platessa]|uniref:Ig-like domain-containing protein n=1 Tax=Pleuronectes platessa TaxID=8262 RepID=A0A9N7Y1K0_PLEPL|nr:unnamed protein product [Pleuronectes platessa]